MKTHSTRDHVVIDRRWHSSILRLRSFRVADCDTDHHLEVAKVRERLAVSKRGAQTFRVERCNLKMLSERQVRERMRSRSQTGLQLWRTLMVARTEIGLRKTLKRESKSRLNRA